MDMPISDEKLSSIDETRQQVVAGVRESDRMSDQNKNVAGRRPIVLVGGAWIGAWAWRDVERDLRGRGDDVHSATLTGLGDRAHLARPQVNLDTHVTDLTNLIEYADLRDVVLVGHSYAGLVVTGAADRMPDRIAHIVYVDTGPVPSGMGMLDFFGDAAAVFEQQVAEHGDGWRLPAPTIGQHSESGVSVRGIDDEARAWYEAKRTPQPFETYRQRLVLSSDAVFDLPRTAILCDDGKAVYAMATQLVEKGEPLGALAQMVGENWNLVELDTGHWPMLSMPAELAAAIHEVAAGA